MTNLTPNPKQYLSWLPALLWIALIFFASSHPVFLIGQDASADAVNEVVNNSVPARGFQVDIPWFALAHLGEYAGLTFWIVFGMLDGKIGRPAALGSVLGRAVLLALFVALMDEVYQIGVPGRHFQWVDLGMDLMGMLLAGAGIFGIRRIINRREPPEKR
jgi:VanZ family protein